MDAGTSNSRRPSEEGHSRKREDQQGTLTTRLDKSTIQYATKGSRHDDDLVTGCSAVPENAPEPETWTTSTTVSVDTWELAAGGFKQEDEGDT